MKVKGKRLLAVLCGLVTLCNSGMGLIAHAQEIMAVRVVNEYHEPVGENVEHGIYDIPDAGEARAAMLTGCTIGISVSADGVRGSIRTGSTVQASEIGIRDIRLEKYVDGEWVLVGTHPGGSRNNDDVYAMDVSTSSAVKGVQYRLSCYHYAILEGVRHEVFNQTKGVVYTK